MSLPVSRDNAGPRVTINSGHGVPHVRCTRRHHSSTFPIVFGLTVVTTCIAVYDLVLFAAGLK